MPRPRGRHKTARLTVNLDEKAYSTLLTIAQRDDVALAWVIRRAVTEFIERANPAIQQPALPLTGSAALPRPPSP